MLKPATNFRPLVLCIVLMVSDCAALYNLRDNYTSTPDNFFGAFTFFTDADPTQGFVKYVDITTASTNSLIGYVPSRENSIFVGTNLSQMSFPGAVGPESVRLTSKNVYSPGTLVLADIIHMPGGVCGTWPAIWMTGPNWPFDGEIDIIEGVNEQVANLMTLHTDAGCSVENATYRNQFEGQLRTANCDIKAPDQGQNVGCQIAAASSLTYGNTFNARGGGMFIMEWTGAAIKIWFFARDAIPVPPNSLQVDTASFGVPLASFTGTGCDFMTHFQNLSIVIDTTFCGAWAGSVWTTGGCAASTGTATCEEYITQNPDAFSQVYWEIARLEVYGYT